MNTTPPLPPPANPQDECSCGCRRHRHIFEGDGRLEPVREKARTRPSSFRVGCTRCLHCTAFVLKKAWEEPPPRKAEPPAMIPYELDVADALVKAFLDSFRRRFRAGLRLTKTHAWHGPVETIQDWGVMRDALLGALSDFVDAQRKTSQ